MCIFISCLTFVLHLLIIYVTIKDQGLITWYLYVSIPNSKDLTFGSIYFSSGCYKLAHWQYVHDSDLNTSVLRDAVCQLYKKKLNLTCG